MPIKRYYRYNPNGRVSKGEVLFWNGKRVGGKTISIEGTRELQEQLERLDGAMRKDILRRMVLAAGEVIEKVAGAKAPVRTGELASNMVTEILKSSAYQVIGGVGPRWDSWYGLFQEYGTARHWAQPFLRPAFDEQKLNAVRVMAELGRYEIRRAVR